MKNFFTKLRLGFIASIMLLAASSFAQTKISGKVSDGASKESLIGVSIAVKGKVIGTISDSKGNFALSTTTPTPFTISVSSIGYKTQEITVSGAKTDFDIKMEEQDIMGQEVVVSASRVEESVMKSPVSVEKMDLRAIQNTPSASFYDALKNLKGVDVNVQSLTFQSVTTRGFNGNGNPRVVQLVDGMDNQAPGLNFAVGNIVGISELDLESVELIPGAASALYGPNAMNGIILMSSKSPFLYQGLSANAKFGIMNENGRTEPSTGYTDYSLRYAKAINNKFAFKVNFAYLQAKDWQATNYSNQNLLNGNGVGTGTRATDEGFNGLNIYGDEGAQSIRNLLSPILKAPAGANPLNDGIQNISKRTGGLLSPEAIFNTVFPNTFVSRPGYAENALADYTTKSLKLNAALHYRLNDKVEAILQGNYGYGTSIYTGSDRYSIKNFTLWQAKAELKSSDFYLRAYTTQENSGDSYANSILASGINESWKKSEDWYGAYVTTFAGTYGLRALTDYGNALLTAIGTGKTPAEAVAAGNAAVAAINPSTFYATARAVAEGPNGQGETRYLPGTPQFEAAANEIKGRGIPGILPSDSKDKDLRKVGAKFLDKTAMYHAEGMYNLTKKFNDALEVIVGANIRSYDLNSSGTIFALDNSGKEFTITEYGGYVSLGKKMFDDKFKLSGSMRYDKNQNFDGQFTPRIAGVLSLNDNSNFRVSYQTGFRMPTTQNQYIDLFTGSARLLGGLPFLRDRYLKGLPSYNVIEVAAGKVDSKPIVFNEYKPEKVGTFEVGYKGLLGKRLLVDAYYYSSIYTDFINGVSVTTASKKEDIKTTNTYSISTNSTVDVKTSGWGLGFDYSFPGGYTLGLNGARNEITNQKELPAENQQVGFSTPLYRINANVGNRNIAGTGFGFAVAWRYQEAHDGPTGIASTLVSANRLAYVPQFNTLDIQVSKKIASIKSIIKVGGNNVMGNAYYTGFGNPTVGSTFYVGITFDELLNK